MYSLKYYNGINSIDYGELDKWFSIYLKDNLNTLLKEEKILVELIPALSKNHIKISMNDDLNIVLILYIKNVCCGLKTFDYQSLEGISKTFLNMVLILKNEIRNK